MRRWLAALLALFAVPATAQDAPAWVGVWEGRVGTYPVRLCIDVWGDQPARGAYYYLSQFEPIAITEEGGEGGWIERAPDGEQQALWEFAQQDGRQLRGTWRQGRRRLPFELTPIAWITANEDGPCGSDRFLAPRAAGGEVLSKPAEFDGWRYTALTYRPPAHFADELFLESFAFAPERPGDAAILAALAKEMPDASRPAPYLRCMGDSIAVNGRDGYYSNALKPLLVSPDWLAAHESYDVYCGGAHPSHGFFHRTFDRQSGEEVELARWLGETAIEHKTYEGDEDGYDLVRPALRELILAHGVSDDGPLTAEDESYEAECREAASDQEFWTFGLSRVGMLFVPSLPHVIAACQATYTVPWPELESFLNEAGRAGLARLLGAYSSPSRSVTLPSSST
jgi:hypothetical protein